MNAIRSLTLAAALTLGAALPAPAMTVSGLAASKATVAAPAAFLFSEPMLPDAASRLDRIDAEAARTAAESYFNYDALITLGALALAGGALSAFAAFAARRRKVEEASGDEPAWRTSVFRALQADLAHFSDSFRTAA